MTTPGTRTYQLHLVTEPRKRADELVRSVALALDGGVDWVQLRDKSASAAALFTEAKQLQTVVRQHRARLAVNDRLDVALEVGADAVHLAAQSLPVDNAVHLASHQLLVGRSVHDLDEAIKAARDGADYITFGHVFPTSTHPRVPPRGLAQLQIIVEAVDIPVLAIGGITVANLDQVLSTGCAGVAVISAILSDDDPCRAAASLRRELDASTHQPRHPFPTPTPQRRQPHATHHQPATV